MKISSLNYEQFFDVNVLVIIYDIEKNYIYQ